MSTEWKDYAGELNELLEFKDSPIAVTFTNDPVESSGKKTRVCQAIKMAGRGKAFVLDRETSACPGGSWHCGLTEPPSGEFARGIQEFLTHGEKLTHSITSLWRMLELTPDTPTGISDSIVIRPLDEVKSRPDIVVFICDGEQACRLVTLDRYWDGIPPQIQLFGSLCYTVVAYPVVTGQTNVSFGDWTARRMIGFRKDVVFVSVPYERMANLVDAIGNCSAGTAEFHMPEGMRRGLGEE